MLSVVLSLALGAVLLAAAGMKLAAGPSGAAALATYGIRGQLAGSLWAALGALEAGLAVCVIAGSERAMYAAGGLFVLFTAVQANALMRGRGGAPCACFGSRGTLSRASVARSALLAAGFAALPLLPREALTTAEWLGVGLGAAFVCIAGLAVALLALARELGTLRMAIAPQGALEIPSEGPEVGGRTALVDAFGPLDDGVLGLAVFTSDACHICHALEPAIASFERDPRVSLRRFDEVEEAEAWRLADIPGSPFAVAIGDDGTVLAKGTFNSGGQLESVLATAERRRGALSA